MALPKKELTEKLREWGIGEENIKTALEYILKGNSDSLDVLREQLSEAQNTIRSQNEQLEGYESTKSELDTLKKTNASAEEIRREFEAFKASTQAEKLNATKIRLVRKALIDAKANPKAVDLMMRGADMSTVDVNEEDDSLQDTEAVVKPYKDSYSEWFGIDTPTGVPPVNPPSGGGAVKTKEQIMQIKDSAERQKAIAENLSAFKN